MRSSYLIVAVSVIMALVHIAPGADARSDRDVRSPGTKTQVGFSSITVNGRALTGPNSSAQMRDGRMFIPVAAVARTLGDSVLLDSAGRTISVLQQTGVRTAFDARNGQILENGSVVLVISSPGMIAISPFLDELTLPIEIVAPLFNVAIKFDKDKNTVQITRGIVTSVSQEKEKKSLGEVYLAEYEYNLNRYFASNSHDLSINALGRLGDGRFSFISNSNATSVGRFSPRHLRFDLVPPNGHNYVAGDLGAAAGLQLISSNLRGALVSVPVGDVTIAAFGGKATSGNFGRGIGFDEQFPTRNAPSRDTSIFGATATIRPFDEGAFKPMIVTAGGMRFTGSGRNGTTAAASVNLAGRQAQFQADLALGNFRGARLDGTRVDGIASAYEVSGSYQMSENLSVQGRIAQIGSNFLAPQVGTREPLNVRSGGVAWSPVRWLTTSLTASSTKRPNSMDSTETYVSGTVSVSPGENKPTFYLSHTRSSSLLYKKGDFTLANFSQSFRRVRLFASASRVKNFGPASATVQLGTNFAVSEKDTLELNQGFASRGSSNGLIEWRTSRFLSERVSLSAGAGYSFNPGNGFASYQKLAANINLPRESMIQVNYLNTPGGPTLMVKVRGLLFRKREASAYLNSLPSEVNSFSRVSGRVYQDIDNNGKYDQAVDKPQASVKVRVDGNRYVETDANGLFAFEALPAGESRIYVDLLSVRADLELLDGGTRNLVLEPGKITQFDFRLVRTGRVTGRVWLDANGNGAYEEGEAPLSDIRVVTASGRDTLTDSNGFFTIADLPPGEHVFYLDEKTLPEKMVPAKKPLAVECFAGRETREVFLTVVPTPPEVKHFGRQN